MILKTGKEYINRSGETCVVLDLDYNGKVLVKHLRLGRSVIETHHIDGNLFSHLENYGPDGVSGKCPYDIICEKLNAESNITYEIYCLGEDNKIGRYATLDSFSKNKIEKLLMEAYAEGYKFLGVCKITREIVDNKLTVSAEMVQ